MEIKTERLLLCPLGERYLDSTFAYAGDPQTATMMVHQPHDSLDETLKFLQAIDREWAKEKPEFYEFAVLLDGVHIGGVSLYLSEDGTHGELGWIINRKYQHKGYAFEAARALVERFSQGMGIACFVAHCDGENHASRRLMEKLGMRQVSFCGGRRNRGSDEERTEYMYELEVTE